MTNDEAAQSAKPAQPAQPTEASQSVPAITARVAEGKDQEADGFANAAKSPRCGFVAIIGAPNAGKSTLVNALVGTKVTIVSHKVQTTRMPIRGIAMVGDSQLVFVDTPGIFAPKRRLDRAMVDAAWGGGRGRGCHCPDHRCGARD